MESHLNLYLFGLSRTGHDACLAPSPGLCLCRPLKHLFAWASTSLVPLVPCHKPFPGPQTPHATISELYLVFLVAAVSRMSFTDVLQFHTKISVQTPHATISELYLVFLVASVSRMPFTDVLQFHTKTSVTLK